MSSTRRMSLLDATFLNIETRETPMHVAGLQIFSIPAGAGPDFVHEVVAALRGNLPLADPFGLELTSGPLGKLAPSLVPAADVDLDYHVRHTALPSPGGERELGELVSHLHSVVLDRSRPLWTCHVIEGLEGGRFAIYLKIHHALTDGVNGMRLVTRCLAGEPDGAWCAPWQYVEPSRAEARRSPARAASGGSVLEVAGSLTRAAMGLVRRGQAEPIRMPFEAPPSVLNLRVTAARRVATQQLELSRVKAVAKATGTSVNDVFLAISGTALRRHLLDSGLLPDESLIAGVPVSLRQEGEAGANHVGFVWASLATDLPDARARLEAVATSMTASKDHLHAMTPPARKVATMLTMAPAIAVLMGGLGTKLRPMNVTISNVPGPDRPLYLNGARMEAIYPVSVPFQGQSLNISCLTYDGQFNIGFTGSRDTLPHLQRMAVYAGEALVELESTLGKKPSRLKAVRS